MRERLYSDDEILFPFIIFSLTSLKSYDERTLSPMMRFYLRLEFLINVFKILAQRTFNWTITILDIDVDVIKNIKNKL